MATLPITDLERALALVVSSARDRKGWSQARLARETGLSISWVERFEGAKRHADTAQLERVIAALGVPSLGDLYAAAAEAVPAVVAADRITSTPAPTPVPEPTPRPRRAPRR